MLLLYTGSMLTSRTGTLVTLDPGKNACGVALWSGGELLVAGAVRAPALAPKFGPQRWAALGVAVDLWLGAEPPGVCVIETMKVYVKGKADPDDLLELAGVAGAVAGLLGMRGWAIAGVKASEWNGQVPSDIRRARTQAWVEARGWTPRVDLATTARFQQDVWSAVGIGKWCVTGAR
jgi:hypothetical protein